MLTTQQAADALGVSVRGVQKMIERGKLRATRMGRDYVLNNRDVARAVARPGKRRPVLMGGKAK